MARIRTLKPEFWTDEKMAPLDPLTRLVFLALVSLADDAGRLLDNVKQLDGQIFPYTEDSSAKALDTLATLSRIIRYTSASGQPILQIKNWALHQRVDKPSRHVLAAPEDGTPRETVASLPEKPRAPTLDLGPRTKDLGPTTVSRSRQRREPVVVDSFFEAAWSIYPKRGGGNSKVLAVKAFIARRLEGVDGGAMVEGATRYARFCVATGAAGGQYVMQAATFFGPGEHWTEQWALPVAPTNPNERTAAKVPSAAEGRAAAEREKADDERRARIDRAYVAARTVAVREWAMQQPPEVFAAIEAKVAVIFGGMTGPMAAEIRKGAVDAECAKRAGFPDVDAWVIIENTKRRASRAVTADV